MATETQIKPDRVYKMINLEKVSLSPAKITKSMVPYLSENEARPALRFINIEDGVAKASDGRRFIYIDLEDAAVPVDIPDGAYRPVKDDKDWLLISHSQQLELIDMGVVEPQGQARAEFEIKQFNPAENSVSELLYRLAKHGISIDHRYAE